MGRKEFCNKIHPSNCSCRGCIKNKEKVKKENRSLNRKQTVFIAGVMVLCSLI